MSVQGFRSRKDRTRGLTKLQGPTLEPLQYFFPDPSSLEDDDGPQLIHGLKIFLANNLLTRLPGRLLRLENLTVLSLRGNKLTELPPAIGNLVHLRELNVGSNNLRWLPYEIRDLLKRHLKLFGFHPNPFIRPMPRYKTYSWMLQHHFCSSKPALLHSDGTLVHNSPPSPTNTPVYWPKVQPGTFEQEEPEHTDRVPSLYETCLRNLYHSPQLSQLPFLIPGEAPPSLVPALKHTWYLKQEGGQRCTICKTPFIMPRTEWIEWWQLSVKGKADAADPEDRKPTGPNLFSDAMLIGSPVPLLRRGCSWACVPKSAINRTGWSQAKGVQSDDGPSTLRHIDSEEWRPPS